MELSLVLPAYNEKKRLENAVKSVQASLKNITSSYEIIIAEDGSTDGTDRIAKKLSEKDAHIIHLHSDKRQGRGKALTRAFRHSKGRILAYIDVDLATDMKHLKELISSVKDDGYDFATGSRMLKESSVKRNIKREIASKGFNLMTRTLLKSKIKDHQCGFKSFRRKPLMDILGKIKDKHWFWDTEMLIIAQRSGYKIKEFPIKWRAGSATTVDITRDVIGMGSRIIRMWKDTKKPQSKSKKRQNTIIGLLIGAAILLAIAGLVGLKDVTYTISSASPKHILLASAIFTASYLLRGKRFDELLKGSGKKLGLAFSTKMVICSQWANLVLPARMGDLLRAILIKKYRKIEYNIGIASLLTERVFDIISIILLGAVSLFYITQRNEYIMPSWIQNTMNILSIVAVLLTLAIFVLMYKPKLIESTTTKILNRLIAHDIYTEKITKSLKKFIKNINNTVKSKKSSMIILICSIGIWLMETLIAYTVALSMNMNLAIEIIFLAVSLGNLTKATPNTPSGLGTYEAALSGVFIVFGAQPALAFSVALVDHFIKNIITLALGSYTITRMHLKRKDITKQITSHQ